MYLTKAKVLADARKKELLPVLFAKPKKDDQKKYLTTQEGPSKRDSTFQRVASVKGTSMMSQSNNRLNMIRFDKRGQMKYLDKLDIAKMAKSKVSQGSISFGQNFPVKNIKSNPGEVNRQISKAITTLHMKKLSDIVSYNLADNSVLKRQMNLIKSFSGNALPVIPKKQYSQD